MTGRIELDQEAMLTVAGDLETLAGDLPDLLGRARGLQAGHLLTGLSDSGQWATSAATDLRDRVDLLRNADQLDTTALEALGFTVRDIAGGRAPVLDGLLAVDNMRQIQMETPGPVDWSRKPQESLDDYVQRMIERGITGVLGEGPVATTIGDAYDVYGTYNGLVTAAAGSVAALKQFNLYVRGRPLLNTLAGAPQLSTVASYLRGLSARAPMTAPFTSTGMVNGQAVRGLLAMRDPALLTTRLGELEAMLAARGHPGLASRVPSLAPAISRVASTAPFWFGSAWTAPSGATVARGSTNLVTVARSGGFATALRTSGAWRATGIVGGVAATGYDVANLISQGDPRDAFQREGAGYVADVARTGFNASLTAAMIAPNPITWGAVGVTGVVWAGAEIVDNWDDISEFAGETTDRVVDWGGDRLDDATDAVGDLAGGAADVAGDVAEKANPMNWF